MSTLKRETNPPVGKTASPTPQYMDSQTGDFNEVKGLEGAPFARDPFEYRGLSTSVKPEVGVSLMATYIEMDKGNVYYWTGSQWTLFLEAIWT